MRFTRNTFSFIESNLSDEQAQTTLSNYENGKNLITAVTLYTICKTYKISMDKFLSM